MASDMEEQALEISAVVSAAQGHFDLALRVLDIETNSDPQFLLPSCLLCSLARVVERHAGE